MKSFARSGGADRSRICQSADARSRGMTHPRTSPCELMPRAQTEDYYTLARSDGMPRRRRDSAPYHAERAARTRRRTGGRTGRRSGVAPAPAASRRRSGGTGHSLSRRRYQRSPDQGGCSGSVIGPAARRDTRRRRRRTPARSRRTRECTQPARPGLWTTALETTGPLIAHMSSQFPNPFIRYPSHSDGTGEQCPACSGYGSWGRKLRAILFQRSFVSVAPSPPGAGDSRQRPPPRKSTCA